jgi:hypothetical protein
MLYVHNKKNPSDSHFHVIIFLEEIRILCNNSCTHKCVQLFFFFSTEP